VVKLQGFVAYPSAPYEIGACIKEAVDAVNKYGKCKFISWEENDIAGRPLTAPIFSNIEESNIIVADITKLNFNVTYEVGYAIGIGRRIFLIKNKEIKDDNEKIKKIGIYDTLGYETYPNSKSLSKTLQSITDTKPLNTKSEPNRTTPVYILETPVRGQITTQIISRVKKARLFYRSFTPEEEARLSANDAIANVASSCGVVVPLLSSKFEDFDIHNIRAAFVAGLSHGMGVHTLLLQANDGPVPLDVRDFVKIFNFPKDIDEHVHTFSLDVYEKIQEVAKYELPEGNLLSRMVIGDPMAENEFQTLGNYYLQTDEFLRAVRGEVNLVVGRKGTGKTALFSQVRNKRRENRKNIVVDLLPEGYQLIKFKEQVLDYLSGGSKAHLITAFWEYLLYLEVCYKILEKDKIVHMRDEALYEGYRQLKKLYSLSPNVVEGDFSERLLMLSESIAQSFTTTFGESKNNRLSADQITALIHSDQILELRKSLSDYLKHKDDVWILFDNIDKGWSSHGLAAGDVIILRCLIDATRKLQRDMQKDGHECHGIVFVRNDVYQLLMDESPDFGKESRATLDWSDSDLLREMLRKRLIQNDLPEDTLFEDIWSKICVRLYKGEETSQYIINHSLMRPRNVLKIFKFCRGFAVNLNHEKIEIPDLEKGLKSFSNDLIVEADQELTDIEPAAKGLIYQFIGEGKEYTDEELKIILEINDIPNDKVDNVIDFLLYYGFFGVKYLDKDTQYIFDVGYDMQILRTLLKKNRAAIKYMLYPAFWPGLGISN